jgi:hypothetical protein
MDNSNNTNNIPNNEDNNRVLARFDIDDNTIQCIAQACKDRISDEVANKAVEILAGHVLENNKLKEDLHEAREKSENAIKNSHEAKKNEMIALKSMKSWRRNALILFIILIIVISLFTFGGEDILRLFGRSGCVTFAESRFIYSRTIKYYTIYFRYTFYKTFAWIMDKLSIMLINLQNNLL